MRHLRAWWRELCLATSGNYVLNSHTSLPAPRSAPGDQRTLWMLAHRRGGLVAIQATDAGTPLDGRRSNAAPGHWFIPGAVKRCQARAKRLHVSDDGTAREFVEKSM